MSLDNVAVIAMARLPEPGKVKTQFASALSPEQSSALHRVFLQHSVARFSNLAPPELVMCFEPPGAGQKMFQLVHPMITRYFEQGAGDDFGEQIEQVARDIGKWYGRMLFVGIDSPDVPSQEIARAGEMLATTEVVVGTSTTGGGLWCVGFQDHVNPRILFEHIDWDDDDAAAQTIANARNLDCSAAELSAWETVERPEDLQNLLKRLATSTVEDDHKLLAALSFLPQGVTS